MIQTEVNKNIFGKKKGYIATIGQWEERGKTAKEAKDNLQNNINWLAEQDQIPVIRWTKNGETCFILTCNINGYQYCITDNERKYPASCLLGQITQREALQAMENHINQY